MTIIRFLDFPDTIEEWEENTQVFCQDSDFIKVCKEELEERKQDLLKYLPEPFHPFIYDGTLNTTYPSPNLRKLAADWVKKTEEKTLSVMKEYDKFFKSIKKLIPPNAQKIHDIGIHDAKVLDFKKNDKTFEIIFGDRKLKFTFTNVKKLAIPNRLLERWWLYAEIYPTEIGFELRVLFDDMSELFLEADNVLIDNI